MTGCEESFNRYRQAVMMTVFFLALMACAGPQTPQGTSTGVYHVVKKGETAYSIARAYSVSLETLVQLNDIPDIAHIKEGQVIFIPDAREVIEDVMVQARKTGDLEEEPAPKAAARGAPPAATPQKTQAAPSVPAARPKPSTAPPAAVKEEPKKPGEKMKEASRPAEDVVVTEKGRLVWPVQGKVKTAFGIQPNKTFHNWIRISCTAGAPVRSAAAGTVIYSSTLSAYGETIIIRHSNGFATVYTHLKTREVQRDQTVKKGQVIARAGETDEAGACFIHFEIRHHSKPKDPLIYLP
jgi:lipoprotein NlpD